MFADLRQLNLGAERFERVTPDSVVMGAWGSSGNLEGLLDSVSEWGRQLRTGHTDWALKALKHRLGWDARRPSRRAYQALLGSLFPDHPYGRVLLEKDVDEHGFVAAGAWLDRQIRPERSTLVIASDVPPSPELWAFIEGEFGSWKRGDAGPPEPAAEPVVVGDRGALEPQLRRAGYQVEVLAEQAEK